MERVRGELPENWIAGRNPIREALKAGRPLEKLVVAKGDLSGAAREIVRMARESGVVVQEIERARPVSYTHLDVYKRQPLTGRIHFIFAL